MNKIPDFHSNPAPEFKTAVKILSQGTLGRKWTVLKNTVLGGPKLSKEKAQDVVHKALLDKHEEIGKLFDGKQMRAKIDENPKEVIQIYKLAKAISKLSDEQKQELGDLPEKVDNFISEFRDARADFIMEQLDALESGPIMGKAEPPMAQSAFCGVDATYEPPIGYTAEESNCDKVHVDAATGTASLVDGEDHGFPLRRETEHPYYEKITNDLKEYAIDFKSNNKAHRKEFDKAFSRAIGDIKWSKDKEVNDLLGKLKKNKLNKEDAFKLIGKLDEIAYSKKSDIENIIMIKKIIEDFCKEEGSVGFLKYNDLKSKFINEKIEDKFKNGAQKVIFNGSQELGKIATQKENKTTEFNQLFHRAVIQRHRPNEIREVDRLSPSDFTRLKEMLNDNDNVKVLEHAITISRELTDEQKINLLKNLKGDITDEKLQDLIEGMKNVETSPYRFGGPAALFAQVFEVEGRKKLYTEQYDDVCYMVIDPDDAEWEDIVWQAEAEKDRYGMKGDLDNPGRVKVIDVKPGALVIGFSDGIGEFLTKEEIVAVIKSCRREDGSIDTAKVMSAFKKAIEDHSEDPSTTRYKASKTKQDANTTCKRLDRTGKVQGNIDDYSCFILEV